MFNENLGFNPYDKKTNLAFNKRDCEMRGKFISSFGPQQIYCYNGNPRKKISSMAHTDNLTTAVHANLNNDSDVYFYVNGGRKQYAINEVRACFVDIDAGRDSSGNYLSSKEVMAKKREFIDKINSFPVTPTWVVDTRNGYQVYWVLDGVSRQSLNKTRWNGIQKKLVNYFGGDARAIKINQIYRVPYTWWRKCWEKKAPYYSTILEGSSGQTVSVKFLIEALTGQPATVNIVPNATSDAWFEQWRKTYKKSDTTGVPVSYNAAADILRSLSSCEGDVTYNIGIDTSPVYTNKDCGQKNTKDSVWGDFSKKLDSTNQYGEYKTNKSFGNNYEKAYGDPSPVLPSHAGDSGLDLSESQAKLLKTVVEYLNQASTALYFSNNRFLSGAARDLASQISDKFCIG
jgi:hypothetical protein